MTAIFDRLAAEAPPVRGVMHAAAEFGAIPIASLTAADIDRTLRPKIDGTVFLERLTRGLDLDFLVLFSSAASVLGAADYCPLRCGQWFSRRHRRSRPWPGPAGDCGKLGCLGGQRGQRIANSAKVAWCRCSPP